MAGGLRHSAAKASSCVLRYDAREARIDGRIVAGWSGKEGRG